MGAQRNMADERLKPLSRLNEVDLIGSGRFRSEDDFVWLEQLRNDPAMALELGQIFEQMSETYACAFPGQTRVASISPQELRDRGYAEVAEEAELLGLKRL